MELRILLVDDNPEYRFLLRQFLERGTTYVVVGEASDGAEAILKAGALNPDVVVMDIMMPVMNGIEATIQIKHDHPGMRVVALTNSSDENHARDMREAGVDGYFIKSESVDKLLYMLDTFAIPNHSKL